MFSPLARGYGSWTGDIDLYQSKENTNDSFPKVGYPDPHRHGVTVSPRGQLSVPTTAASSQRIKFENTDGKVDLPKTFLTRKGALLLFTAPEDLDSVEFSGQKFIPQHRKGKKLLDLSLKLGTLDRLCKSVLQYGDEEYDHENSSVTDPRNRLFLKFIRQTSELDTDGCDAHSQPGGELGFYLRDLKSRANSRLYGAGDPRSLSRSPELRELLRDLDGALPRTGRSATCTDFTESPRGSPKQRVLSSKKLTASLKSSTYLGRPTSAVSASTTAVSEAVGNLPRIASQSSIRSRTSTKSGLWVQGYDLPTQQADKTPSKSNSAKSRSSKHTSSGSENGQAPREVLPASQNEDDVTSAADEQDILLPSDAEDEDGFGEQEEWPHKEVMNTENREESPAQDEGQDMQSMTQPLMPQYTVNDIEEAENFDVPLADDLVPDGKQDLPGGESDSAGIQEIHIGTRVASRSPHKSPVPLDSPTQLPGSPTPSNRTEGETDGEIVTQLTEKEIPEVGSEGVADAVEDHDEEYGDEDVTVADVDAILAAADLDVFNEAGDGDAQTEVKPGPESLGEKTLEPTDQYETVTDDSQNEVVTGSRPQSASTKSKGCSGENSDSGSVRGLIAEPASNEDVENSDMENLKETLQQSLDDQAVLRTAAQTESMSVEGLKERSRSGSKEGSRSGSKNVSQSVSKEGSESGSNEGSRSGSKERSRSGSKEESRSGSKNVSQNVSKEGSRSGSKEESRSGSAAVSPETTPFNDGNLEESSELVASNNAEGLADKQGETTAESMHSAEAEMQVEDAKDGEKPSEYIASPVPYTIKETTDTETSGYMTPETIQMPERDVDQLSGAGDVAPADGQVKDTSSDAGEPVPAAEEPQTWISGPIVDTPHGTQLSVEEKEGVAGASPSSAGTPVKEKGKVTFNEKLTSQTVPRTPVQTRRQPHPPKTKAPVKTVPKARVPVRGGNQRGAKPQPKTFVKAIDITSVQPEEATTEEKQEMYKPPTPEKKVRQKLPPARHVETKSDKTKSSVLPSHMEEVLHRRSASKSQEELDNEMAQMSDAIENTLAGPTMSVDFGEEGLTAEELTLAQEALLERVKEAESKIDNVTNKTPQKPKATVKAVVDPKSRKKKKASEEEKRDLQKERAAIREQRKREKQQRLEEALQLQEKIKAREAKRKAEEEEAKRKARELAEEIEELKREEEEIQQAEEDARRQLAMARKHEREARERRRKEDLERKKQEAIRRREKEKQMMEAARQKEEEMLKRIADNEMKRQLQEEEQRKREDEERMAQEQYEEELRQAQKEAEEEEQRMRELEKEAEEEAMQRLIDEREEAERRRWKLNELARQMEEEEERKRQQLLEEERHLEAEKKEKEMEEQRKLEEERKRLQELQRLEQEARETMRQELERRRDWAQKRREVNLERRENLDNVRHGQGITRAWVFSYFPDWPLDSYNKLMGEDPQKKQGFRPKPKPKPPAENPPQQTREITQPPPQETGEITDPSPN